MQFKPCVSRSACTEDGLYCRSCGRSHDEIFRTRSLINTVSDFLAEMNYENREEFLAYLNKKVIKKLNHSQSN